MATSGAPGENIGHNPRKNEPVLPVLEGFSCETSRAVKIAKKPINTGSVGSLWGLGSEIDQLRWLPRCFVCGDGDIREHGRETG